MTDQVKRIELDIGAAAEMLQASPELCTLMNDLVGGPALVEAQGEIERLKVFVEAASYYINRLETAHKRRVVRDMTEAMESYHAALAALSHSTAERTK